MPEVDQIPVPIEGCELLVEGQDIKPLGRPKRVTNSRGIVFPLAIKKRGRSAILKEYIPKKPKFYSDSLLDEGSEISGPELWGFSSDPLSKGDIVVGETGRTGAHQGQSATITGTCFMMVTKTWTGYTLEKHPKKILLE